MDNQLNKVQIEGTKDAIGAHIIELLIEGIKEHIRIKDDGTVIMKGEKGDCGEQGISGLDCECSRFTDEEVAKLKELCKTS